MKEENREKYLYPALFKILVLAAVIIIFFIFYRFGEFKSVITRVVDILKPFLYGAVLAYLLRPFCDFIEHRVKKLLDRHAPGMKRAGTVARGAGIVGALILFTGIIYMFVALVFPQIISSVTTIIQVLPENINRASAWLEQFARDNDTAKQVIDSASAMIQESVTNLTQGNKLMPNIQAIIAEVSVQVWSIVVLLKNFLIGIVVSVYLLSCKEKLAYQVKVILLGVFGEKWFQRIREEIHIVDSMFEGFINGKLIDSLIIGLICFFFMNIFKWPFAVLISTIIGVTNIIPFFGPFIGAVPAALLMLMVSPLKMVYLLIFIFALQQYDGNILGPKILGNTTGLSSFWVLFSITFFGGLWGIVGMIVGVPLFAVIYDLVGKCIRYFLRLRGISQEQEEALR